MKFKEKVIMGSSKTGYLLACSKEEIKLLFGIVKTARKHFPENFELSRERRRLNNILKELKKIYEEKNNEK